MKIDPDILLDIWLAARELSQEALLAYYRRDETRHHERKVRELIAELEPRLATLKEPPHAVIAG